LTAAAISPRARRELAAAVDWIARDNPRTARAFRDAVGRAAELIGDHPHIGVVRRHLLHEPFRFRSLTGFPYLIVYNSARTPPEIIAIVHGARDLPPLLRDLR